MAWHLPVAGAIGLAAGIVQGCIKASNGEKPEKCFEEGLKLGLQAAGAVATLGLVSPDAGIDISSDGVCYDPDHSCTKDA